jgi:hypothetical protein
VSVSSWIPENLWRTSRQSCLIWIIWTSGALHMNGQIWPVEPGANFSEDVIVVRVNSVVGFCVSLQSKSQTHSFVHFVTSLQNSFSCRAIVVCWTTVSLSIGSDMLMGEVFEAPAYSELYILHSRAPIFCCAFVVTSDAPNLSLMHITNNPCCVPWRSIQWT